MRGARYNAKMKKKVNVTKAQKEKRIARKDTARAILGVVGSVGVIAVGLVAPGALMALDLFADTPRNRRRHYYINNVRARMIRDGHLKKVRQNGEEYLELTKKGEQKLEKERIRTKDRKSWRWNREWYVVIFDIKEYKRSLRQQLREELIEHDFVCLQKSVWVSPYDHEDLIGLIKAEYEINAEIITMRVRSIENDYQLRRHFGLPLS